MDQRQRTKRFGLYVILCALVLRLIAEGIPQRGLGWLLQQPFVPIHTYSETGRDVRFSASSDTFHVRESPPPWMPGPEKPVFSRENEKQVAVYNTSSRALEVGTLLEMPLNWNLMAAAPTVLILHTHGTESYAPMPGYRTVEAQENMLSIGDAVAEILEEAGIGVLHDRNLYDHPSYNGAYTRAREAIAAHLENNPGIQLVLDLHRDAAGTAGKQLRTEAVVNGEAAAQLMLVQGTNFDSWQENLSLAVKLHALLEQGSPGIMRPLNLRSQRFNQDLCPGALLVEVGAAGNTRQEALLAARALAEAIVTLAAGSSLLEQEDSV